MGYIRTFWADFKRIFRKEFKDVFSDSGVLIIFFLAGVGYPLLYNLVYRNGLLDNTPIAVVDEADCAVSRRYLREVDATRELEIAYRCATMEEAERLMRERKANGIIYIPASFAEEIAEGESAKMSVYADMGSFFYYKNLLMGSHFVMLDEFDRISPQFKPLRYEENNPYNRAMAFNFFFITAALMLVIQQTMFYGMAMLAGTRREENRGRLYGTSGRLIFGRGAVYWLIYIGIGMYVAYIVPAIFDLPCSAGFMDMLLFLVIYVSACVMFSTAWSFTVRHRETPIVALLFFTLPALFLTGFSWPQSCFPGFWNVFSYVFPSTFGARAFMNLSGAGADLGIIAPQLKVLLVQTAAYFAISVIASKIENSKVSP